MRTILSTTDLCQHLIVCPTVAERNAVGITRGFAQVYKKPRDRKA